MTLPSNEFLGGNFGLGWMIKNNLNERSGPSHGYTHFMRDYSPQGTIGHTGFTGTSIVMDLVNELSIVLLTNRVFPTRDNMNILRFRRMFHNIVFKLTSTER